jgi:hypothetical protein
METLTDHFSDAGRLGRAPPRQQQGEFLAAHAPCAMTGAFQQSGKGTQHVVAHGMAVAVVDLLEMVDVTHDHGAAGAPFARNRQIEALAVEQAGQTVALRSHAVGRDHAADHFDHQQERGQRRQNAGNEERRTLEGRGFHHRIMRTRLEQDQKERNTGQEYAGEPGERNDQADVHHMPLRGADQPDDAFRHR